MALKAGRVGVHPDDVDLNGHIKQSGNLSDYVKKTDAPGYNDILTQTSASSTYLTQSSASSTYLTQASATSDYQPKLVSGTNIKTINNESLLGSGNIVIQGGGEPIDLSGYVQKTEAPGYADILTQTSASSIYQTQSGMSAYQTTSGMSSYVAKTDAPGYADILTQTSASGIYQTQSGMSAYQTTSGMSSYVAKTDAPGYADILTTTNAATVYQVKLLSGSNIKTVNGTSILGSGDLSVSPNFTINPTPFATVTEGNNTNMTKDALLVVTSGKGPSRLFIDNVEVFYYSDSGSTWNGRFTFIAAKGQNVKCTNSNSYGSITCKCYEIGWDGQ